MSIRLRRHLDWRWRCDRRSGEVSNPRGIVACKRIVKQSENALMKYDQTFPIGLAALSGHLVVWSIRFATRRGWAKEWGADTADSSNRRWYGVRRGLYYRWAMMFVGWESQVGGREEFETLVWRVYWGEPGEREKSTTRTNWNSWLLDWNFWGRTFFVFGLFTFFFFYLGFYFILFSSFSKVFSFL